MARIRVQQPQVRKSVLVFGGVALGVALIAFILLTFVGGGGGGDVTAPDTSSGTPSARSTPASPPDRAPAPPGLRPGGRDPFRPVVNTQAAAAAPAPQPAAAPAEQPSGDTTAATGDGVARTIIGLQAIHDGLADLTFINSELKNVKPGTTLAPTPPLPDTYVLERITGDCAFVKRGVEIRRVCTGETIVL